MNRILGLDPGLSATGWGVVDMDGPRLTCVAFGTVRAKGDTMSARLAALHRALVEVLERHRPGAAAVEETFVNGNAAGSLKLGQARGVVLAVPALSGLEVGEYAATRVKRAVVGTGRAEKSQVAHMVRVQLGLAAAPPSDAADALAVAICHAHHLQTARGMARRIA